MGTKHVEICWSCLSIRSSLEALEDSRGSVSRGICGSFTLVLVPHMFARCRLHWPIMQSYYLWLLLYWSSGLFQQSIVTTLMLMHSRLQLLKSVKGMCLCEQH